MVGEDTLIGPTSPLQIGSTNSSGVDRECHGGIEVEAGLTKGMFICRSDDMF